MQPVHLRTMDEPDDDGDDRPNRTTTPEAV